MISREVLEELYSKKRLSVSEMAGKLDVAQGTINYWLAKHRIPKRSIGDALYQKWNPKGDPFQVRKPKTTEEAILFGLGIGLYWGEGTKTNKTSIRLANSDPRLVKKFISFLISMYGIKKMRLRFGLQIFADMNKADELQYWIRCLGVNKKQFYKTIVTPYRGVGNYRQKTKHGVLTVYFNNRKLRDILCNTIDQVAMDLPR